MNQTRETSWVRWVLQTARTWDDISVVIKETGIEKIDNDHRHMTDYALAINNMIDTMERGEHNLDFINHQADLLQKLYDYTLKHFSREEDLIQSFNMDGYNDHKSVHEEILAMIRNTIDDFNTGRLTISQNLKIFLSGRAENCKTF